MPINVYPNQATLNTLKARQGALADDEAMSESLNRVLSTAMGGRRGELFIVDGTSGVNSASRNGKTPDTCWATIDYAVGRCVANNGDTILVMPGTYDEAVTVDVATVRIIGADRDLVTGMRFIISANGVEIGNMRPSKTDSYPIQSTGAYQNIYLHDLLFRDLSGFTDALIYIGSPSVAGPIAPILRNIEIYNVDNASGDDLITLIGKVYGAILDNISIIKCVADNMIRLHFNTPDEPKYNILKNLSICNNSGTNGIGLFLEAHASYTTVQDSVISGNTIDIRDSGVSNQWINVKGVKLAGTHTATVAHGTAKQDIVTNIDVPRSGPAIIDIDVSALVTAGEGGTVTIRLERTDGDVLAKDIFIVGTDEIHPSIDYIMESGSNMYDLTIQLSSAVTANRSVPYEIRFGD